MLVFDHVGMDVGAVVVIALTVLLAIGPLYVLLVKRTPPVPRDWSGRPSRGVATTGTNPLDGVATTTVDSLDGE